jgi:hypothetical protein
MNIQILSLKCSRCDNPVENNQCTKCNLVYCPFCGCPENLECGHLLADWAGLCGQNNNFKHSPFGDCSLPFVHFEYDSPITPLPVDPKSDLGDLSPLLKAYGDNPFETPNPVRLFQEMVGMLLVPCFRVSRKESEMAGAGDHEFWFTSDVTAARAELISSLYELSFRFTIVAAKLRDQELIGAVVHPELEETIYGEANKSLVFARRRDVNRICACHKALKTSKTWGEFRSLVGANAYNQALINYVYVPLDFATLHLELLQSEPGKTIEQAREEYLKMEVNCERLPEDTEPFSEDHVPILFEYDWPEGPAHKMLKWIPEEIQRKYGSVKSQPLIGKYLALNPSDEHQIVAALSQSGYRCTRDDTLIQRISRYNVDLNESHRKELTQQCAGGSKGKAMEWSKERVGA